VGPPASRSAAGLDQLEAAPWRSGLFDLSNVHGLDQACWPLRIHFCRCWARSRTKSISAGVESAEAVFGIRRMENRVRSGPQLGWKASAVSYPVTQINSGCFLCYQGSGAGNLEITVEGAKGEKITNCQRQAEVRTVAADGDGGAAVVGAAAVTVLNPPAREVLQWSPNETLDIAPSLCSPSAPPNPTAISLEPQAASGSRIQVRSCSSTGVSTASSATANGL